MFFIRDGEKPLGSTSKFSPLNAVNPYLSKINFNYLTVFRPTVKRANMLVSYASGGLWRLFKYCVLGAIIIPFWVCKFLMAFLFY